MGNVVFNNVKKEVRCQEVTAQVHQVRGQQQGEEWAIVRVRTIQVLEVHKGTGFPRARRSDSMNLEHIALSIADRSEIEDFYLEVLGMKLIRTFQLDRGLAGDIFGIAESPDVFLLQKDQLQFEVFLASEKPAHGFVHICISTTHREAMLEKAARLSYRFFRLKREYSDLVFISDKSGNVFEVKEAGQD